MMSKNRRAKIGKERQYVLWPDEKGLLTLPPRSHARSSALLSQHSRQSHRVRLLTRLHRLPLSSSLLLLLEKSLDAGLSYVENGSRFERWLSSELRHSAFGALTIPEVVGRAKGNLGLDESEIKSLLLKSTRRGADFRSKNGLVTLR